MRIIFIADIFGRPGCSIVRDQFPNLVSQHKIDLVLANGENAAAGSGITPPLVEELLGLRPSQARFQQEPNRAHTTRGFRGSVAVRKRRAADWRSRPLLATLERHYSRLVAKRNY